MNENWHARHPMPKPASREQRVIWHRAHAKHCACRPVPPPLVSLVFGTERHGTDHHADTVLRPLLSGGDRRSIAQSKRARRLLDNDPRLIKELASLTDDADWLVALRALDLMEKIAHDHPERIAPYKRAFIGPLADREQWEIRLQIVRALPLFGWTPAQMKRVEQILIENASFPQSFVRAWALDSLASLSQKDRALRPAVQRGLKSFARSTSKALRARARLIRQRLEVKGLHP
jgi:hypothetical protein